MYDNRVITFAPIYCSDLCVNNCLYCGFRAGNSGMKRRCLTMEEDRPRGRGAGQPDRSQAPDSRFRRAPAHRRAYIAEAMRTVAVGVPRAPVHPPGSAGSTSTRRQCPSTICASCKGGHGLLPVFGNLPPRHLREAAPAWHGEVGLRLADHLYAPRHGIRVDDVGIGALFGLYDWRFG